MELQQRKPRMELCIEVIVHVLTWSYIFLSPLFFKRRGETIDWNHYLYSCFLPLAICITFYLNYFILVPRYLLVKGKVKWFYIANVALFAVYQSSMELQSMLFPPAPIKMHHLRLGKPSSIFTMYIQLC